MRLLVACCAWGLSVGCAGRGRPPEAPVVIAAVTPAPRVAVAAVTPAQAVSKDMSYALPGEVPLRGEEELQAALARDVRDIAAHAELARLYLEYSKDRPNYAILARQVIAQASALMARSGEQSADLLTTRGLLDLAEHHPDEAMVSLAAAVEVDPQHRRSLRALGETALLLRDDAQARDAFQALALLRTGDAGAWLQLAIAERRLGNAAAADRALRRAQELAPADPRPQLGLSEAFLEAMLAEGVDLGAALGGE